MTRILIIDDNDQLRLCVRDVLESMDYEVDVAESADAGIKLLREKGFDIILLDHNMPEKNGLWFVENAHIPPESKTLFMTGGFDKDTIDEAIRRGVDGYILKPFSPDQLQERLKLVATSGDRPETPQIGR